MIETPNLKFPLLVENQAGAHVKVNEALIVADIMAGGLGGVTTTSTPPGSPSNGDVYMVGSSPSGAWTGQAGKLAIWHDGVWRFYSVPFAWSTAETATNLFRDGAQVYTKVIVPTMTSGSAPFVANTAHGITGLNLAKPIEIEAYTFSPGSGSQYNGPNLSDPVTGLSFLYYVTSTNLALHSNFSMAGIGMSALVRLWYTKT